MNDILNDIKEKIILFGAVDVGFTKVDDFKDGFNVAISIIIPLSNAIINEIEDKPTYTYFTHYRSVNALIDSITIKTGLYLQSIGYDYITIPASQSVPTSKVPYSGRYSHKKIAHLSGLGSIGKSALFLHKKFGARVRLGTIFTTIDPSIVQKNNVIDNICGECNLCVKACPAMAIKGVGYSTEITREDMFDAKSCSDYMKSAFKHIGRGAVCGICIKVCPKYLGGLKNNV